MVSCGAIDCKNRSNSGPGISKTYHSLPAESKMALRKEWINKIKRQIVPKNIVICSDHFDPSCYERDLQVTLSSRTWNRPKHLYWR